MEEKTPEHIALERIENAVHSNAYKLNLSGLGLKYLPPAIGKLSQLEHLDLHGNNGGWTLFKSLPPEIGELTNLKTLVISNSSLETLPPEIGLLKNLISLDLNSSQLRTLPKEFAALTNLTELELGWNRLDHIPEVICELTNLRSLQLNANYIKAIPEMISSLINLEYLGLGNDSIPDPSDDNYDVFIPDVRLNHFRKLSERICYLKKLKLLVADGVGLEILPKEIDLLVNLEGIHLENNNLTFLPLEIRKLKKLTWLGLVNNPLPVPPNIIKKSGQPELILNAYFDSKKLTQSRNIQVFLCHASNDKPRIRKLYNKLKKGNFDVWLDEKSLLPGQEWESEIPKAIANSDAIIICLSNNSVTKEGFFQKEIRYALDKAEEKPEGTIFIIPALLEECEVPQRLSKRHWVKLFEKNGYNLLVKALSVRATNLGLN